MSSALLNMGLECMAVKMTYFGKKPKILQKNRKIAWFVIKF